MSSDLDDLILYRLSRARETLEEARILADANHWNACVNRLYYACFYAVLALLIQNELITSKHQEVTHNIRISPPHRDV
jgi:uncharacterized protein (UPF0332 family)